MQNLSFVNCAPYLNKVFQITNFIILPSVYVTLYYIPLFCCYCCSYLYLVQLIVRMLTGWILPSVSISKGLSDTQNVPFIELYLMSNWAVVCRDVLRITRQWLLCKMPLKFSYLESIPLNNSENIQYQFFMPIIQDKLLCFLLMLT